MKRTLVTTLTVAGVLGSGGIAMASVWDSGPALPSVAPDVSATLPTLPTLPSTSTTLPAGTTNLVDYLVGDAGVVRVEVIGNVARVVSATPNAGWTARIDDRLGEVEVEFTNGLTRIEFEGAVVNGQLVPVVQSQAVTGSTSTTVTAIPAAPVATTGSTVLPATPAPAGSVPSSSAPSNTAPSNSVPGASSTTSPSGGHGSDDDDSYDDSDDRSEDHDDDRDSDDHDDDHGSDDDGHDSDDDHGGDDD